MDNDPQSQTPDTSSQKRGGAILNRIGKLDIQPGPLLAILNAPANDPDKVSKALSQSPTLGARVLSVTNSAAIGVVDEINDIRRAVLHMGSARARSIAMAFAMHMLADESGLDPKVAHRLWINSLEKAYLARIVAELIDPQQAQAAYTLGLIQDVGLSALWAIEPVFYENLTDEELNSKPLHELEREHFGIDHAVVGSHLLELWNASPQLCDQVFNHHQQALTQPDASAVDLANMVSGILPHDGEPMTPERMQWLDAVHGQFLSPKNDSADTLIRDAVKAAKEIHGGAPSVRIDAAARARILNEIDVDTAGMVRQLCAMETLLTQKHEQVNALEFEAMTDPLTQILNRRGFNRLGERRLRTAVERGLPVCVVMIDLDGFKQVNDAHGHDAGDHTLTEAARLLRSNIDSSDLIGRLGGDEFAIFQINVSDEIARRIVQRVVDACVGQSIALGGGKSTTISFSIGAATCAKPTSQTQITDLLSVADDAMYTSKRAGTGGITFTDYTGRRQAG